MSPKNSYRRRVCKSRSWCRSVRGSRSRRAGSSAGSLGPTPGSGRRTNGASPRPVPTPSPAERRIGTRSGWDCWRRRSPCEIRGTPTSPALPARRGLAAGFSSEALRAGSPRAPDLLRPNQRSLQLPEVPKPSAVGEWCRHGDRALRCPAF